MFEDDVVVVTAPNGETAYKGILDYCPWKDDDWRYDKKADIYTLRDTDGVWTMKQVA